MVCRPIGPSVCGRETRLTNPTAPAPIPEINQAGGAALQTGKPRLRSAPPAKVGCRTAKMVCRSSPSARTGTIHAHADQAAVQQWQWPELKNMNSVPVPLLSDRRLGR